MNADGARLKCNRDKPCQNCTARNEQTTCKYKYSKNGATTIPHQDEHGDPMQQRIDQLEGLVKRLVAQRQEFAPNNEVYSQDSPKPGTGFVMTTVASDASDVASSAGTTVIDGIHSVYKGADDWYDVLQEVSHHLCSFFFSFLHFFLFCLSFLFRFDP
jgi:hypothetical protein